MFRSFFKKSPGDAPTDGTAPDISRVIPGYGDGTARIVPKTASRRTTGTPPVAEDAVLPTDGAPEADRAQEVETPLLLGEDQVVETAESVAEAAGSGAEGDDWLRDDVRALREAADRFLETGAADAADGRRFFLIAHNMRGAAGAYGYPVIERITGSLCLLLERDDDPASAAALINLHVEACRAAANHQGSRGPAELADAVCTALEDQVLARLSG